MSLVATEEIAGVPVEIHASSRGTWSVTTVPEGGEDETPTYETLGSGETLDQAKQRARTALAKRKVKVHVEFVTRGGARCIATGIHARNRTIMVREEDGASYQETTRKVLSADIPADELERYLNAHRQAAEANVIAKEIEKEWSIDLYYSVERAIDQALEEKSATT